MIIMESKFVQQFFLISHSFSEQVQHVRSQQGGQYDVFLQRLSVRRQFFNRFEFGWRQDYLGFVLFPRRTRRFVEQQSLPLVSLIDLEYLSNNRFPATPTHSAVVIENSVL